MVTGVNFSNYQDPIKMQQQAEALVNSQNFNLANSYIAPVQLTVPQPVTANQSATVTQSAAGVPLSVDTFTLANSSVAPYTFTAATNEGNVNGQSANECDDGKDDGNIGFWAATGNVLKGVGKFFWSAVSDEKGDFSLWQTLKTVAIGTAIALIPGAAPVAIAAGGILGAAGTAKSIYDIVTAKTDAEDKLAWQSFGSSATALALSLFGARQYAKASNPNAGFTDGVKQTLIDAKNNIVDIKNIKLTDIGQALKNGKSIPANMFEKLTGVKYADYKAMSPEARAMFNRVFLAGVKSKAQSQLSSNWSAVKGQTAGETISNVAGQVRTAGTNALGQLKNPNVDATLVLASDQTPQFYA